MIVSVSGNWRLYWGATPLPTGAEAVGTVERAPGDVGALLLMPTGYVQGNAGSLRSIDQAAVKAALAQD